jgi:hypothetical protein
MLIVIQGSWLLSVLNAEEDGVLPVALLEVYQEPGQDEGSAGDGKQVQIQQAVLVDLHVAFDLTQKLKALAGVQDTDVASDRASYAYEFHFSVYLLKLD